MTDKLGVALVHELCPICCKEMEHQIILNKRLDKSYAKKVEEMNGQAIGFADKPCEECQAVIDKGAFIIIGVDEQLTNDWNNPYRSGHIVGIKKESEFYKSLEDKYKEKDAIYMDYRIMQKMGLIK